MDSYGSVSQLIAQAKGGDEAALGELHQRYWPALVNVARKRLNGAPIRGADEEDIAQGAFLGFYRSLKARRVPRLENRHQLLALLTHIVACKALNQIKHDLAQRRGGGMVTTSPLVVLAQDTAATPEREALLHDCYEYCVSSLPESLRPFAELHLAGFTNREIAERMECVERTVERKLALLRTKWQQFAADSIDRNIDEITVSRR